MRNPNNILYSLETYEGNHNRGVYHSDLIEEAEMGIFAENFVNYSRAELEVSLEKWIEIDKYVLTFKGDMDKSIVKLLITDEQLEKIRAAVRFTEKELNEMEAQSGNHPVS